jgi:hypothetical protein
MVPVNDPVFGPGSITRNAGLLLRQAGEQAEPSHSSLFAELLQNRDEIAASIALNIPDADHTQGPVSGVTGTLK